jgi:hypothetical protein
MQKYLLFLFVLSTQCLFAQDYQNICTPGTTFYRSPVNSFMAFRRDSVIPAGNSDTIFISYRAIRDTTGSTDCMDTTNGSVLGRKIVKNHSGWFYFFNKSGDTVKINSQASLNQSWKFCMLPGNAYMEAKVTSIGPDSVLGLIDQVKVITFQAKDAANNDIAHNLNQKSIKISQHYGLSKSLDIYSIPDDTTFFVLAGKTFPALGMQDLTWQEIYNFEVGDVFHYSAWSNGAGWKTIKKVLSKTAYGIDSIVYTMEHCVKTLEANYPYYETTHDTITTKYILSTNPDNSLLSRLPDEFFPYNIVADAYSYSMFASQNRKVKSIFQNEYLYSGRYNNEDTCWRRSEGYYTFSVKGNYAEGLGKTLDYLYLYNEGQPQHREEDLVYYKKGSEIWGTPVSTDCFSLVGIPQTGKKEITVSITPNPVETRTEIQVSDLTENDNSYFILKDFLGRSVMQNNLVSNPYNLNREGLPAGLYFLSVYNKNGNLLARVKLIFN